MMLQARIIKQVSNRAFHPHFCLCPSLRSSSSLRSEAQIAIVDILQKEFGLAGDGTFHRQPLAASTASLSRRRQDSEPRKWQLFRSHSAGERRIKASRRSQLVKCCIRRSLSHPSRPKKRAHMDAALVEEHMRALREIEWDEKGDKNEMTELLKGISWAPDNEEKSDRRRSWEPSSHAASKEAATPPSKPYRTHVLRILWDELKCKTWSPEIENHLNSLHIRLTPNEVEWVLRAKRRTEVAWNFFNWAASRPGYQHDIRCYNAMVRLLGCSRRFDLLQQLLDKMQPDSVFSITTLNMVIGFFSSAHMVDKAEEFYLKLQRLGLQPNAFTYKRMLHVYLQSYQLPKALDMYMRIRSVRQPLDNLSYNALINALAKDGQVESACKIFWDMKVDGYNPDVYTYTILVHMFGKIGQIDRAIEIFNEMSVKQCKPNFHTFSVLLGAFLKENKIDAGLEVFERMAKSGILPTRYNYNFLANVLAKADKLDKFYQVLNHLQGNLKNEACEMLIKSLARMGYFKESHNMFMRLAQDGHRHSEVSYLTVIESCCKMDDVDVALSLMRAMKHCGHQLQTSTCNMIISTFRNKGRLAEALEIFEEMKAIGPAPDTSTYNTLITGLGKAGKQDFAIHLFKEMEQLGCMPNVVSYNSMINSFSRLGDISSTYELIRKMEVRGMSPNVVTYNSIIDCFGRMGYPDAAVKAFHQMAEKGCSPNFHTYNYLLNSLARAGRTHTVLSYYRQMLEHGCMPDAITFGILDRVYTNDPNLDRSQLEIEIKRARLAYEFQAFCTVAT